MSRLTNVNTCTLWKNRTILRASGCLKRTCAAAAAAAAREDVAVQQRTYPTNRPCSLGRLNTPWRHSLNWRLTCTQIYGMCKITFTSLFTCRKVNISAYTVGSAKKILNLTRIVEESFKRWVRLFVWGEKIYVGYDGCAYGNTGKL